MSLLVTLFGLVASVLATAPAHAEPLALRTVVMTGQPAPGGGAFDRFSVESLPIIAPVNRRQQVAFFATVTRGPAGEGIFIADDKGARKIAAEGDPAPAGGAFAGFGPPALNNHGLVAFGAVVEGRATPGGIFVADGRQVRMVIGAGDETPIGGIFAKFSERLSLNDAGTVAFTSVLKNAPAAAGVFVLGDGRARKVAAI